MVGHVLILGGTGEARLLAEKVAPHCDVTVSLAGRTNAPTRPAGNLHYGGFGGEQGLASYMMDAKITLLIDATHPYAARMGWNALGAARRTGIPLLRLERPPWVADKGDVWHHFTEAYALARLLPDLGHHAFVTLGGADLAAFQDLSGIALTIRAIDPPTHIGGQENVTLLLARGPFELEAEIDLLQSRKIDIVVSRNSGGIATWPKIAAARALSIPVAMIDRPQRPHCETCDTFDAAMAWLETRI